MSGTEAVILFVAILVGAFLLKTFFKAMLVIIVVVAALVLAGVIDLQSVLDRGEKVIDKSEQVVSDGKKTYDDTKKIACPKPKAEYARQLVLAERELALVKGALKQDGLSKERRRVLIQRQSLLDREIVVLRACD